MRAKDSKSKDLIIIKRHPCMYKAKVMLVSKPPTLHVGRLKWAMGQVGNMPRAKNVAIYLVKKGILQ